MKGLLKVCRKVDQLWLILEKTSSLASYCHSRGDVAQAHATGSDQGAFSGYVSLVSGSMPASVPQSSPRLAHARAS